MSNPVKKCVLIVDDEENLRYVLNKILSAEGYQVLEAANGHEGLDILDRTVVDFILCDVLMPVMDGNAFLHEATARRILAPIIMLSAYGTVDSAVAALKAGAFDYVFKPFHPDEIVLTLKKAEERERLRRENLALRLAASRAPTPGIVARSKAMVEMLTLIDRVAQVNSPVLITGESGTGKELVARAIHTAGSRAGQPFVAVNCGAIPDKLLESELFGHVRGAFTDAVEDRPGLFREADRGTLFLDEAGELDLALQVKLLRVLQFQEVRPVGGTTAVKVDVRIVAATARDLPRDIIDGRFREDLYYRLNVLPLSLAPLRDRPDDVPALLEHFLVFSAARLNRPRPELSAEALEALVTYSWPGNIRELENLVDRLLVLAPKERIELDDLPTYMRAGKKSLLRNDDPETTDLKTAVKKLEIRYIREALALSGGNRAEAARRLGISYPSMLAKIKIYRLDNA